MSGRGRLGVAVLLLLAAAGCGLAAMEGIPCTDDSQCGPDQLCFQEGCGEPDQGIVVEVTANTRAGHHAQDFAVTNLTVIQNIEVFPPLTLVGEITTQLSEGTQAYKAPVTVRAVGESALIPGVTRRYEASFSSLERGAYSMFLGAGNYTLTATATADTSIPADIRPNIAMVPGKNRNQNLVFNGPDTAIALAASLVKTRGVLPARDTLLTAKMDVQAFDPLTQRPLSQKIPVTRDDGSFTLWMDPAVDPLSTFLVVATPSDPLLAAPSKSFVLTRPLPDQIVLEMGAFGQSLPGIVGVIEDGARNPVAGAMVFIEGTVGGGGTYRTRSATTNDRGIFQVEAFLSAPSDPPFTLTAIPPPGSPAGVFRGPVRVLSQSIEGYLSPQATFTCPDRVPVTGTLLRPPTVTSAVEAAPAPAGQVKVIAEPIAAIDGNLLPPSSVEGRTDDQGRFSLALDPAEYRLDFLPGEGLPRRSRFVTVRFQASRSGTPQGLELTDFQLANGRTISGLVTAPQQPLLNATGAVPNAAIRYFRTAKVAGKKSSVLLAETLADERGHYKVVLPSR